MRILAVNWRDIKNPEAGGAEVHLHEILLRLARWGHAATQVSSGWPGCSEEDSADGVRIVRRGRWYDANVALLIASRRVLRSDRYDVVLEDINKLPFFTPLVTKLPVIVVVPHLFGSTAFREANPLVASIVYLFELLIPLVFRRNTFIVISDSTRDDLVRRGVSPERIHVVLCGLDHEHYRNLALTRFEQPTIVHLGRLRKYKSVEVVLRAMRLIREALPEARLVIIGDGPHRGALEREARRLDLGDSVEFRGFVGQGELVSWLNRAHLLVNPSPKEGWGLTVVEGNACGLPVVASDRPGLRDSVVDRETGFLVPYGDDKAFAAKALEILRDPKLWARMSAAALERVKSLTWDRTAKETLDIVDRVLRG
jgi:glycosyltransferase involved in cell wall biosynthesis